MDSVDFEEFVEARWAALVRAACLLGCSRHEAEDLVQTTLTKCFVHWPRVSRAGNADKYVYTALLNQQRTNKRRRWWSERPTDTLPEPTRSATSDEPEHVILIHNALGRLTPAQRRVVVARHILDLSEAEAADVLGIPAGTVKSRLARALSALAADPDLLTIQMRGA